MKQLHRGVPAKTVDIVNDAGQLEWPRAVSVIQLPRAREESREAKRPKSNSQILSKVKQKISFSPSDNCQNNYPGAFLQEWG